MSKFSKKFVSEYINYLENREEILQLLVCELILNDNLSGM